MRTRIAAGLAGGLIGSVLMAGPFLVAHRSGTMRTPPPARITRSLLARFGLRADREAVDALTAVAHLGFGATAGAIYGAVAPRVDSAARAVVLGMAYGTGIYAVSYAGWVPALRLMPPPDRDQPQRQAVTLVNHWLFGATLALAVHATDDRDKP